MDAAAGARLALRMLASELEETLPVASVRGLSDDDVLTALADVEAIGRRVDSLRVTLAGELAERSRSSLGSDGLASKRGCRNAGELLRRVTLVSVATAGRRMRLGQSVLVRSTLTGNERPARFASVASGLASGLLGLDSAVAIVDGLTPVESRCLPDDFEAAERALVGAATGVGDGLGENNGPGDSDEPIDGTNVVAITSCPADETRMQTAVWRAVLDPDGVEPAEERAMSVRGLRLGRESGGLVRLNGTLLAPAAAQLEKLLDAHTNPRTAPTFLPAEQADGLGQNSDRRTPDQKRHDILVSIVDHAARCAETPSLGGAAPSVIVTVAARDLGEYIGRAHGQGGAEVGQRAGSGHGFIEGVEAPVSIATISRYACAGGIQRAILNDEGGIVELGSTQRCFTAQQRRAITLRDGGCIIPGCHVPAAWCEVHHVQDHARGGATHTDNGVLLCWYHHRTLDTSGWQIRMTGKIPHIKAPPWIGTGNRWQPATGWAHRQHQRFKRTLHRENDDDELSA
jgi:hypothetical protein